MSSGNQQLFVIWLKQGLIKYKFHNSNSCVSAVFEFRTTATFVTKI